MQIFGFPDARYYCAGFSAEGGEATGSLKGFETLLKGRSLMRESEPLFAKYRSCSLREAERALILAASHYRRSLELMSCAAAPWAQVTLYYSAFFSAFALLAVFGCAVGNKVVIDVASRAPGAQLLRVRAPSARSPISTYRGPHRVFWDLFYAAVGGLRGRVEPRLAAALSPVTADPVWQIERRNEVNYQYSTAVSLMEDFSESFDPERFPASLPGVLGTQYAISEALLEVSFQLTEEVGLSTDALHSLQAGGSMREVVRNLVYGARTPGLVRKTRKSALV